MKFQALMAVAGLAATTAAYPFMAGVKDEMLEYIKAETLKREANPDPVAAEAATKTTTTTAAASTTGVLTTLASDIAGILGSVAASVEPDNLRPQKGYTFKAPTSTDSRGPCPGLNLLANYGYLPR